MRKLAFAFVALAAAGLVAAPAVKLDPVAAGFPQWQGISPKSHVMGREITASDLRQRVTVVVEFEPGDGLKSQFLKAAGLLGMTGLHGLGETGNWESLDMPRSVILLFSNRGAKDPDGIKAAMKPTGKDDQALSYVARAMVPVYDGVMFAGGPETEGKRPYIYVMGPSGTEPLAQGALDDAGLKAARAAISKAKSQLAPWQKFYGTVDPERFPAVAKAIEKGKPLGPVATALLKDVLSKDEEKARESQIVYDALSQTRSDLVYRIMLEARACPHRAYYDFQHLVRHWPSEKKKVDDAMQRLKAIPDAEKLAKMFCKAMAWSEPDFECKNAGEAKKIVAELKKMKPQLEKMKESKVIVVQNGALLLDSQIDTLIETIPGRVAGK